MAQNYFHMKGDTRIRATGHLQEIQKRLADTGVKVHGGLLYTRHNVRVLEVLEKTTRDFRPQGKDELYLSLKLGSLAGRTVSESKSKQFHYDNLCKALKEEILAMEQVSESRRRIVEAGEEAKMFLVGYYNNPVRFPDHETRRAEQERILLNGDVAYRSEEEDTPRPAIRVELKVKPEDMVTVIELIKPYLLVRH